MILRRRYERLRVHVGVLLVECPDPTWSGIRLGDLGGPTQGLTDRETIRVRRGGVDPVVGEGVRSPEENPDVQPLQSIFRRCV